MPPFSAQVYMSTSNLNTNSNLTVFFAFTRLFPSDEVARKLTSKCRVRFGIFLQTVPEEERGVSLRGKITGGESPAGGKWRKTKPIQYTPDLHEVGPCHLGTSFRSFVRDL